jgi:hypothetical protein
VKNIIVTGGAGYIGSHCVISLIENGLDIKNIAGTTIEISDDIDSNTYIFDGYSYATINNYNKVNTSNEHSYTISLFLKSDDWNSNFGYQIFGNLMDKGLSLLSDTKVTPFITVQNGKSIYVYNTDFNLVDESVLSLESNYVKDLYRSDHLDSYYSITNPYIIL